MALEDMVQRSGEQLVQRIRQQTEQEVRGFIGELLAASATERATAESELQQAVQEERDRVRTEVEQIWVTSFRAAAAAAVPSPPEPAPAVSETNQVLTRLLHGVRRLDAASRLDEALDTLAELAGDEAPRAAVLTAHEDRVRGWRFIGFGSALDSADQVDLAFGEAGIVGGAVIAGESRAAVSGPDGAPAGAAPAFTTLSAGVHALAAPVRVGGEVIAVVYGDDTDRRPAAAWREAIELLALYAGHCLEALTAARLAQLAPSAVAPPEGQAFNPSETGPTLPFDESDDDRSRPEA